MSNIENKVDVPRSYEQIDYELKRRRVMACAMDLSNLSKNHRESELQDQYWAIRGELSKLGFDKFYCVIKTSWRYHEEDTNMDGVMSDVRNNRPDYAYYYTPLLCFLDNNLEPPEVGDCVEGYDLSYEILSGFSPYEINASIDDIMSMRSMVSHWRLSKNKSIVSMREHAVKFGEKDQFEKLLLVLIDKFPSIELLLAILDAKDQDLIKRMMPWIKEHTSLIHNDDIIPVVGDFPDDLICELIDNTDGLFYMYMSLSQQSFCHFF